MEENVNAVKTTPSTGSGNTALLNPTEKAWILQQIGVSQSDEYLKISESKDGTILLSHVDNKLWKYDPVTGQLSGDRLTLPKTIGNGNGKGDEGTPHSHRQRWDDEDEDDLELEPEGTHSDHNFFSVPGLSLSRFGVSLGTHKDFVNLQVCLVVCNFDFIWNPKQQCSRLSLMRIGVWRLLQ